MSIKFTNNASAQLASSISSGTTSISVQTGQGALFPSLTGSDYFYATLVNSSNVLEIVKVTARTGDVLTVVRGQDGTSATSYNSGDKIELRPTAGGFNDIVSGLSTAQTNITTLQGQVTTLQGENRGPAFSAYGSANQTIADQTYTKVAYNTEEYDTNSCYDTTNARFTPNVAGYYHLNAVSTVNGSATGGCWIMLYKNGSLFKNGHFTANTNASNFIHMNAMVYANGTTDYFEIYVWQNSGAPLAMGSSNANLCFQGFLARPAT